MLGHVRPLRLIVMSSTERILVLHTCGALRLLAPRKRIVAGSLGWESTPNRRERGMKRNRIKEKDKVGRSKENRERGR